MGSPLGGTGGVVPSSATQLITCTLTPGAEAADVIAIVVQVVDTAGNAVARVQRILFEVREVTMLHALQTSATMAVTAGTLISTTAKPSILVDTTAAGACTVTVTDVAGASGKTFYVFAKPSPVSGTNAYGVRVYKDITFD